MIMNETEAARTRAATMTAERGDEVDVTYTTSHGNTKTKRGEVRQANGSRVLVVFPDGKRWEIVGTTLCKNSHNRLRALRLHKDIEEPEVVLVLRAHSRVDSVERDGDEWVAHIEGNSATIRHIIEGYGAEITERAKSPWNPEEDDPRPMRFRVGES